MTVLHRNVFVIVSVQTINVGAVLGRTASIPCDISTERDDVVYMVLWYRDTNDRPIYRLV